MLKSRAAERSAPDESVEAVRRRARYRLVGALVLVVIGVVGFPLVFDTEPRAIEQELAIVIPDKQQVAPLAVDAQSPAANLVADAKPVADVTEAQNAQSEKVAPAPSSEASQPETKVAPSPEPKAETKAPTKTPVKAPTLSVAKQTNEDATRAQAILEGRSSAVNTDGQWVVQVGAFGDKDSVDNVRRRLEASGLKVFTQAVAVASGEVTRVRLGPYASEIEANRALVRAKSLGFSAAKAFKP